MKETADTLGLTEATVKTRLLRARLKLREALSVYYAERLAEGPVRKGLINEQAIASENAPG